MIVVFEELVTALLWLAEGVDGFAPPFGLGVETFNEFIPPGWPGVGEGDKLAPPFAIIGFNVATRLPGVEQVPWSISAAWLVLFGARPLIVIVTVNVCFLASHTN